MSYRLHAYRPILGVATVQHGSQWMMVDLEDVGGRPRVVSEADVQHLGSRLELLPWEKVFANEAALLDFLRKEYLHAHKGRHQGAASEGIEDDLDFLDQAFVMDWLRELQHCLDTEQFDTVAPRTVLKNLETLARHPRFEKEPELLALLNPLKNAWERRFAIPIDTQALPTLADAAEVESRYPNLNGSSLRMREAVSEFASFAR